MNLSLKVVRKEGNGTKRLKKLAKTGKTYNNVHKRNILEGRGGSTMAYSEIYVKKRQIRQKILEMAANLDMNYKRKSSKAIGEFIQSMEEFQKAEVVFSFMGRKNEVHTKELIEACWQQGKRVALPLVISKGIMEAKEITAFSDLTKGTMDILEPKKSCKTIRPQDIDFGIIPCVTCSHKGERIGFGGGFYDRYLAETTFTRACVCYEQLTYEDIPMSRYDLKMDYLVTELGIIYFGE